MAKVDRALEKGVRKLNPTKQVMKSGSEQARAEVAKHPEDYKGSKPKLTRGNEDYAFDMKTYDKHADGKKHEDHHPAVKSLKGKY